MLADQFPGGLAGIYLYGSIALDAFDERRSDIDILVLLDDELNGGTRSKLRRIHRALHTRSAWWKRSEGLYASPSHLAADRDAGNLYPAMKGGNLRGVHRLGWTERKIVHERGVVVAGPHPSAIIPPVTRSRLDDEMWYNLHGYWAGRAKRPYLFLHTNMVRFAVATLPRIIHALEHGEIVSKQQGISLLRERFPEWESFAEEVMHARAPLGGIGRARAAIEFIHAMIDHADRTFGRDEKFSNVSEARSGKGRSGGLLS